MSGPAERTERCRRCGRMFYWLTCFAPMYGNVCSGCFHELVHGIPLVEPDNPNPVLSPSHYTHGGTETIDFIRAKLTPDEFRGFCKGSIIKYLSRANLKGNEEQDYAKAAFYSRMLAGDDPRGEAE